jgi:hypothetical protein
LNRLTRRHAMHNDSALMHSGKPFGNHETP